MTGGVEEGNLFVTHSYAVSTNVLSDAACFFGNDIGVADGIEQRGFTMVNMTHYNNNG